MPCLNPTEALQPAKESLDAAPDPGVRLMVKYSRSARSFLICSFLDTRCYAPTTKVHYDQRRMVLVVGVNPLWPAPWPPGTSDSDVLKKRHQSSAFMLVSGSKVYCDRQGGRCYCRMYLATFDSLVTVKANFLPPFLAATVLLSTDRSSASTNPVW